MSEEVLEDVRNKIKDIGVNFLENANLLENTAKELIINKLIDKITIGEKQFDEFFREYLKKHQINEEKQFISFLDKNNFSKKTLRRKLLRSIKIQKLCINEFKKQAKDYFLQNKNIFDKVSYTLIRTSNLQLAKELYLQIEGGEENIHDLAEKYSEGDEKLTRGIVGPIPLNQGHYLIRQKIGNSKEGELIEPFQIENWWIILKIEKLIKINYSNQIETSICRDLFEARILKTSKLIIKELRTISECEQKKGSDF